MNLAPTSVFNDNIVLTIKNDFEVNVGVGAVEFRLSVRRLGQSQTGRTNCGQLTRMSSDFEVNVRVGAVKFRLSVRRLGQS